MAEFARKASGCDVIGEDWELHVLEQHQNQQAQWHTQQ